MKQQATASKIYQPLKKKMSLTPTPSKHTTRIFSPNFNPCTTK